MGLRSLPFFKAKKGWMFAGGGLSADGGGGGGSLPIATTETLGAVRVGYGLNVANDGTLTGFPFPVPDGYVLKCKVYDNISLSSSQWATLDTMDVIPLLCVGYGQYGDNYNFGYANVEKSSTNIIRCSSATSQLNNVVCTVYLYYLERSE